MPKYRTSTTLEIDTEAEGRHYNKTNRFEFYLCNDCLFDDIDKGADY